MPKFELEKETAKVKFMLEKKQIPSLTAEVVAIIDVSGSTQELFKQGTVQETLQRIVPVALNFDDNGELPVYAFSNAANPISVPITAKNFENYVNDVMLREQRNGWWHGTDYSPAIMEVITELGFYGKTVAKKGFLNRLLSNGGTDAYQQNSKSGLPAIAYFITDGESGDEDTTAEMFLSLSNAKSQIYFNFIGIGHERFHFLKALADEHPNVGFTQIKDLRAVSGTDDIYDYLIPDELTTWLKAFVSKPAAAAVAGR